MRKGEIQYRDRARQLRDFSGLLFGNITPTDIDGLIEYHGKAFVIIELKLKSASIPFGQMLALERLTDSIRKPVICIIGEHDENDPVKDIDVAKCLVLQYRFKGVWRIPKTLVDVKQLITKFLELKDGIRNQAC